MLLHNINKRQEQETYMEYRVKSAYKPFLFLFDILGNMLFFWTKLTSLPKQPNSILVMRFDHAGDMVMTLPMFAALRACFPQAKISVLCRPFVKELVENDAHVDEVLVWPVPWFERDVSPGWLKTVLFLWSLRNRFEVVIEPHADPRNILAAFLVGGFRVGSGIRGGGFLLNYVVPYVRQRQMILRNLAIVESLWGVQGKEEVSFDLKASDQNAAVQWLSKNKIKKFVVVHPAAARSEKIWLNDRWAESIDKMIDRYNVQVVITGAGVEKMMIDDILERVRSEHRKKVISLCGRLNGFLELAALIKMSKMVVSVDTVVVHLAHALKIPLVCLYGPTDPVVWGYQDKKSIAIYKTKTDACGVDCRQEAHRRNMMKEIGVVDVLKAVRELLH